MIDKLKGIVRKEPQLPGKIDFAALAREVEGMAEGDVVKQYAPSSRIEDKISTWENARAVTLEEVGMFRSLSLAELDKLLETMHDEHQKLLIRARNFRDNVERGHKHLEEQILAHSERCRAASEMFSNFKELAVEKSGPVVKGDPEPPPRPEPSEPFRKG